MENDEQLELRAEHLTEGASDTSRHVRNVYITFLLLCTYIAVIIGSTTHEQLFRVDPITLPILNVGLPIVGFYVFIPWLLVIFHFNLLIQFYFLSRVLRRADEAIDRIKQQNSQDELRDTLFPFHFSHLLAGRQHGKVLRFLLTIIVWITVMLVPLLLLVWAQVQFLPYHDEMITWVQRAALMADFTILWILWPMTMSPQGSLRMWWWHFITATPKALWAIITGLWTGILVLLKRSSMSQLSAKWASVRSSHHARGAMTLLISTLVLIPFSVFVAVIPGETMEGWLTETETETEHEYKHVPKSWIVEVPEGKTREKWKRDPMLGLTYTLFEADDAPFRRNLVIVGKVLVAGSPSDATLVALQEGNPEEQERAFQEIRGLENLAGRDLRYANLSRSYLPKVNLKSTQLQRANLYGAQLQGANLSGAQLQGANLYMANFQGANLFGVKLQGAILKYAKLSLAVLLKLGRGQFTKENYDTLEKNLSKQNLDEQLMRKILKHVDALIGRADDLVFGPATHHALCDEVDPDRECLTLEQEEQFVKEWVEYIVSLACPDSYITEGLARQAIQHRARGAPRIDTLQRDKASMLAKRLLSPDCKGGADLPDDVREKLQKLSRESGPNGATKPSSNVSSP